MRRFSILLFISAFILCAPSLLAQEKVKAKSGDGVNTLLKRHNRAGEQYAKEFIELNKKKLGKNNTLLLGVEYVLPPLQNTSLPAGSPGKTKKREPLFGKKYAEYEIVSSELEGAVFYLVSGHGGPDPGAIGKMDNHELHEDEYAYDIMLRLARNLLMRGAKVHIIIQDASDGIRDEKILKNSKRETCMGEAIPLNQTKRLKQRSDKINALYGKEKKGYARAIFIHIDSRSRHKQTDVYFYHSSSDAGKRLANTMKSTFQKKYDRHQPGRGFTGTVGARNLYVLKNTVPVGVYVELGNIQNPFDQQRIVINDNRQALAKWMCEAFIADYNRFKASR